MVGWWRRGRRSRGLELIGVSGCVLVAFACAGKSNQTGSDSRLTKTGGASGASGSSGARGGGSTGAGSPGSEGGAGAGDIAGASLGGAGAGELASGGRGGLANGGTSAGLAGTANNGGAGGAHCAVSTCPTGSCSTPDEVRDCADPSFSCFQLVPSTRECCEGRWQASQACLLIGGAGGGAGDQG